MPDPFISGDAASIEFPNIALSVAVRGDRRAQLEAIRDYIAHELESNKCNTCQNSKLRTGDQASLILRLQTVLSEIDSLPSEKEVNPLDSIRGSLGGSAPAFVGDSDPSVKRRTGSRKPGGGRGVGT